jgi:hypothetical protein
LTSLLPGNLAEITLKGKINDIRLQYPRLLKAIHEGKMDQSYLLEHADQLTHYTMGSRYKKLYSEVFAKDVVPPTSTAKNLVALGADKPQAEVKVVAIPAAGVAPAVAPITQAPTVHAEEQARSTLRAGK